jgi:PadR family transcriptional regulator, regulatory protein AphA
MVTASPATFGLLGMLAVRSWTGYELTQQVRRSLRFMWRSSEGHLYREQKRLVALGWATVDNEPAGLRTRSRYTITDAGRAAFDDWLATEPEEPHFQIEGVLRTFFGDQGSPQQLASAMQATAQTARSMQDEMLGFVDEYLEEGGPLWMLEQGVGGPDGDRIEFHGRPMYPERLHVVALAIDITTQILETIDNFFTDTAHEVAAWSSTRDSSVTPATRDRLQRIQARGDESASEHLGEDG